MKITLISKRLLLVIPFLFIFFSLGQTYYGYITSQKLEEDFVKRHANTLSTFMKIHRDYYQELYVSGDIVLNERTLNGLPAYSANIISEKFSNANSFGIAVKAVSDRARNAQNQADFTEMKAITAFSKDTQLKEYFSKEDTYYQYATPLYIEKKCLLCHGPKTKAPKFIQNSYEDGYDYKLGDLRGIISVKIPLQSVHQYFNAQFIETISVDLILVFLVLVSTLYLIRYFSKVGKRLEDKVATKTKALRESLAHLTSYKRAIDEGSIVSRSNVDGIITYVNDNLVALSGYTREEMLGQKHNIFRHPDTPLSTYDALYKALNAKQSWHGTIKNWKKDGGHYWIDLVVTPLFDAHGNVIEYIALRHDITELIQQRETLEQSAYTDTLTGLHNRVKLQELLPTLVTPAMAFIDIDNFSQTNDFYGHRIGDEVIKRLGNMLKAMITIHDDIHLFRLNGDEFVVVCDIINTRSFIDKITLLLDSIHSAPIVIDDYEINLDVTAGISFESSQELLATTDIALKHAKTSKKSLVVYDQSLSIEDSFESNIHWSKVLKEAIKEDRLVPFYQPIINNHTGEIEKYESLIRLIDKENKVISPYFFLDVAKQTKQYHHITKTVIDKSFEVFGELKKEFSINLTIEDILNLDVQKHLFNALKNSNIGPRLVFEIVESEGIEEFSEIRNFIDNAKSFGCKIAIDDFGTGYSNFEYLIKLNADYIKIDGSLIKNLDTDQNAKHLVASIVVFAKELGMKTIAEFVKDEVIYDIVKELGIDYSQGFYFSEATPLPKEDFQK